MPTAIANPKKDAKVEEAIEKLKAENKVLVFSKKGCGFCKIAIDSLKKCGLTKEQIKVVDLNKDVKNGGDYQRILKQMTGDSTVPRVFVDSQFVGGGSETKSEFSSGRLQDRLRKCGFENIK